MLINLMAVQKAIATTASIMMIANLTSALNVIVQWGSQ
jgi:hypothetical protein